MRRILFIAIFLWPLALQGQTTVTYYVSKSQGNDTNSGLTWLAPKRSMAFINNPTWPGTTQNVEVLLKGADRFDSMFIPQRSGNVGRLLTYGAYDTSGVGRPIIDYSGQASEQRPVVGINWWLQASWQMYQGDTIWYAITNSGYPGRIFGDSGNGLHELPWAFGGYPTRAPQPWDSVGTMRPSYLSGAPWTTDLLGWGVDNGAGRFHGLWWSTIGGSRFPFSAPDTLFIYSNRMNPALFWDVLTTCSRSGVTGDNPVNINYVDRITVKDWEIVGGFSGVSINGLSTNSADSITLKNCYIRRHAAKSIRANWATNLVIENCTADYQHEQYWSRGTSTDGAALQLIDVVGARIYGCYFVGSKYESTLMQGATHDVLIDSTIFYGGVSDYQHLWGLEGQVYNIRFFRVEWLKTTCRGQSGASNIVWEYCLIDTVIPTKNRYDTEEISAAISFQGGTNCRMSNMVIRYPYGVGIHIQSGTGYVFENLIIDGAARYNGSLVPPPLSDGLGYYYTRNVAIWDNSNTGAGLAGSTWRNIIIYNDTTVRNVIRAGGTYNTLGTSTYYTVEQFMAAFPSATNIRFVDPQFVNEAAGNYRLEATSPAIDAGHTGGITATKDYYGNSAPYNTTRDIGIYEYGVPPPDPPGPKARGKWLIKAH